MAVEHIKVNGKTLEGNLEGDAVDRDVFVFLPPTYQIGKHRRYPVGYALHGYSIGAEQWTREIHCGCMPTLSSRTITHVFSKVFAPQLYPARYLSGTGRLVIQRR